MRSPFYSHTSVILGGRPGEGNGWSKADGVGGSSGYLLRWALSKLKSFSGPWPREASIRCSA